MTTRIDLRDGALDVDVIMVGAGPSGLMVATQITGARATVVAFEKRAEPVLPRAGVLHPRVLVDCSALDNPFSYMALFAQVQLVVQS